MEASLEPRPGLPPPHEWALDPAVLVFRKVFISQIHKGILVVPFSGQLLFYLRRVPIIKVHIVGCLVSVEIRTKKITYHIDDGTGVIRCVRYLNEQQKPVQNSYVIGDLVMVKGSLEMYETNTEDYGFALKISILEEIVDQNMETYHIAATINQFRGEV